MKKLIFIIMFALFIPAVFAEVSIFGNCDTVTPYDYQGIMECQLGSYATAGNKVMSDQLIELNSQILQATVGKYDAADTSDISDYYALFQYLFAGLLVIVTSFTGYQYMISNDDPAKRDECKRTFKFIIFSGILLVALPLIMSQIYALSSGLNEFVSDMSGIEEGADDPFEMESYLSVSETGLDETVGRFSQLYAQVPLFVASARAYIASTNARNILVLLLISMAPLILLLFSHPLTREYGKLMAYLFVLEVFLPIANIIILHFSMMLSGELNLMMLSSALMLCVAFHLILILATILKASVTAVNQIRLHEVEK
jgi:hypothetical protein